MKPYSKQAYNLFHEGVIALARVENEGMRIDVDYLKTTMKRLARKKKRIAIKMKNSEIGKTWQKRYGSLTNYNSPDQFSTILFEDMGFTPPEKTKTGRYKTDKNAISKIKAPFIDLLMELRKIEKAHGTYFKGIRREVRDEFLHPFFNLHLASTYRSSSSDINFQNIPVRDPDIGKTIRKAFIPRDGHQLVELDYSSLEVQISACYHQDPTMFTYLEDETTDMHRDMAMECYMLPEEEVTKEIRYCGKNMFIFPQFYGDWYLSCTKSLWEAMDDMGLRTVSGTPLKRHLAGKGITERGNCDFDEKPKRGTFEYHIKNVEKNFWDKRFPVYKQWKDDWYNKYKEQGWFKTKTGFICQGYMKRNEVINYPVQGSAFHCLLWSLNEAVLREMKKRKMRSRIVGQIHDSIVADVCCEELDEFLIMMQEIMVDRLKATWDWVCTPLAIEAEVSPPGKSWAEKKEVKIPEKMYGTVPASDIPF